MSQGLLDPPAGHPWFTRLLWSLVAAGVALRIGFFLYPRTLWLDEAMIALNMRESVSTLLRGQLYYYQRAPLGWLLTQKGLFEIFGHSAMAQRLPSLLAGIAAYLLLADAARRWLKPMPALIVVALATLAPLPVYYCAEVKHYAFDLLGASAFTWLMITAPQWKSWSRFAITFNIVGALLSAFSFPFVFFAIAAMATASWEPRAWISRLKRALSLSPWLAFYAAALFWSSTRYDAAHSQELKRFWAEGFWPLFPFNAQSIQWPAQWLVDLSYLIVGFQTIAILAVICLVAGIAHSIARRDIVGFGLLAVMAMVLVASICGIYPPVLRLALFLYPALLLLVGLGIEGITRVHARAFAPAMGIGVILLGATFLHDVRIARVGKLSAGPGRTQSNNFEDIHAGVRLARQQAPPEAVYLLPRFTIPAYAFHLSADPIPPEKLWLERVPPFSERGDIRSNYPFNIWHDESRFSDLDVDGSWVFSEAMADFTHQARRDATPVVLIVTLRHQQFTQFADRLAQTLGPPRRIPFQGGLVFIFDSDESESIETNP